MSNMWLRQSTARTIPFGVFVDSTDGNTEETGLTISQADIRLSKNGGAYAQTNNSAGATHMEGGDYGVPVDTTDTNTLGHLRIRVHESGALPVWADFMVVPQQVWDSLFGADRLQVHVDEITAGLITNAALGDGAISEAKFANNAITDAKVASDVTIASVTGAVGSVAGAVGSVTGAVGSVTGNVGGNVVGSVASVTAGVTVTTNNDKTGYGLSAAAVQAIWDALTSALTTVGSIGKLLADNINATISSRATPAQVNTEADTALADVGLTTTVTGRLDAAISTRSSQASVDDLPTNAELATALAAADDAVLAAVATRASQASVDTIDDLLDTEIGTLLTNVASILDDTGTAGVVVAAASKTGYALSATGLDSISIAAPAGPATTFREMVIALWARFFWKSTLTSTELKTFGANSSDVLTTQVVSDDLTTQTMGKAS